MEIVDGLPALETIDVKRNYALGYEAHCKDVEELKKR